MLHIILFLLNIIGILLLSILGLVLLLAVTVLLVPIRYRVAIKHGEGVFFLKGRVNWLLHILHVGLSHEEGRFHIQARIFGFVIFDNLKPRQPGRAKAAKKPRKAKGAEKERESKRASASKKVKEIKSIQGPIHEKGPEKAKNGPTIEEGPEDHQPTGMDLSEAKGQDKHQATPEGASPPAWDTREEIIQEKLEQAVPKIKETKRDIESEEQPEYKEVADRKSPFKKLTGRFRRIRNKISNIIGEWKRRIKSIGATISAAKNKAGLVMDFIRNELNREGFQATWSSLKKLLRHLLPRKLKSKLIFGTGDPCSTGQALGAMSILYSFYGDRIQITPDFEHSRLEGEHFARGRIRLATILIIVARLLLDKRFKKLKNNFIILKEAL